MIKKANNTVGKLGLENLMSRANIVFTSGYVFSGKINTELLHKSFISVVDRIPKFDYQLTHLSQREYYWKKSGPFKNRFLKVITDDLNNEFKNICSQSIELIKDTNYFPMVVVVIMSNENEENEEQQFIIAQLSDHTHCDAGSSETVFNHMIDYYNALTINNNKVANEILEDVSNLLTIDSNDMIERLKERHFNHDENVDELMKYQVADVGQYRLPPDTIDKHLFEYKKRIRKPIIQSFDVQKLITRCRQSYPEVTINSIVCAALVKGIHNLNVHSKKLHHEHIISFKMLSNLLPINMRKKYSGNYISFIPFSVDGHLNIENMAKDIHDRVRKFKTTQLNLSLFSLVEDAVKASQIGTTDEEISFIVTNWNNYRFLQEAEYLHNCQSLKHISGVNIEPKDILGALLVNRPVMVINQSPDNSLCLSYFPSLRSEQETIDIAESMDKVMADYSQ